MQGYLAPPIFTVFFLGVFLQAAERQGRARGPGSGLPDGPLQAGGRYARHARDGGYEGGYAEGSFLWIVNNIYFQYYSVLIFLVSAAAMVIVSRMSEPPSEEKLKDLTFSTLTEEHKRESRASWGMAEVAWSGVTLVLILAAYLYFNG